MALGIIVFVFSLDYHFILFLFPFPISTELSTGEPRNNKQIAASAFPGFAYSFISLMLCQPIAVQLILRSWAKARRMKNNL